MQITLQSKKMIVAGINGSGKTYLVKFLSRFFKTAVYSPYQEEWNNEDVLYIKAKDFIGELDYWCAKIKILAIKNKINLLIVDDADLLFRTQFDLSENFRTLHIGNRHLGNGLAIVYVTRRIQDIPTKIYGTCEYMALFSIESPQAVDLLNKFSEGLGDRVKAIPLGSFKFILKEIGKEPFLMTV